MYPRKIQSERRRTKTTIKTTLHRQRLAANWNTVLARCASELPGIPLRSRGPPYFILPDAWLPPLSISVRPTTRRSFTAFSRDPASQSDSVIAIPTRYDTVHGFQRERERESRGMLRMLSMDQNQWTGPRGCLSPCRMGRWCISPFFCFSFISLICMYF